MLDRFFSGNVTGDEALGLLDQVINYFAMMCFRKIFFFFFFLNKDFQCQQILKLIAALSHAEPSPPPPHVPLIWITDR